MPTPSIPCTGSPDISILSYSILFDISGATPNIRLTNASTVIRQANLIWWYVITTPSGTPIHTGSVGMPDVTNNTWATLQIASGSWPLLFGNPPCAQVEFSPTVPYLCTVYVKDSNGTIFNLPISQAIVRPNGNTSNSCGNFGSASAGVQVKCFTTPATILCTDSTNFTYNNILTPIAQSNQWILTYPPDGNGNQPANGTATNSPYISFDAGYNGDGYVLFLNDYATYDMGNGATVKVQYKAVNPQTGSGGIAFAVLCNIDLCRLQCQMQAFYEVSKKSCGQVDNSDYDSKKININYLFSQAVVGIIQPQCQIDVPHIVKEIQKIIGPLAENCNCGCTDTGINFNYPTSNPGGAASGCCPVYSNVIDITTGLPPSTCPLGYFPAQVYDPTGVTIIGVASDINSLVGILNGNAAWQAYGTAFPVDNCHIGWYALSGIGTIPTIKVRTSTTIITTCTNGTQSYPVMVNDVCFVSNATITYPLNVYVDFGLGAGPVWAGNVASQAAMVAALNAIASKPASVTFTAGSSPSQVNVTNSNCAAYSAAIVITADYGSSEFVLFGGNHFITSGAVAPNTPSNEFAMSIETDAVLGRLPQVKGLLWHTMKIGNILMATSPDAGCVYFWDITNPLSPLLTRTITLNKVVMGCFSGSPESITISSNGVAVPTIYDLYFPTDASTSMTMSLTSIFVVESLTGCIWELNYYASGTGITASFSDQRLVGKCPRVLQAGILYFSQDGDLEQATGQGSGVSEGQVVLLNTATFGSGGISLKQAFSNAVQYVWAASYDGAGNIYYVGATHGISIYNISADTFAEYDSVFPYPSAFRTNSSIALGIIFITVQHILTNPTFAITLNTIPTTPAITLFGQPGVPSGVPFTFTPIGNCLGILTAGDSVTGSPPAQQGKNFVAVYKINGTFLQLIPTGLNQEFYNVVIVPSNTTTPNTFT